MEINLENLPQAVFHLTGLVVDLTHIVKSLRTYSEPETATPINAQAAADFLGVTLSTIYILNQRGDIPSCKRGKRLYFFKKDLIEWIKVGRRRTLSEIETEVEAYLPEQRKRKMRKAIGNR